MALENSVTTESGITVENAYTKVELLCIYDKHQISFVARSYSNKLADKPAFSERSYACQYDINGANPISQAYIYLKTMPEFAGAVDR